MGFYVFIVLKLLYNFQHKTDKTIAKENKAWTYFIGKYFLQYFKYTVSFNYKLDK